MSWKIAAVVVCVFVVALCCTTMAYFGIFTNLQHQDDEGQLIQSVRNFLVGQPMYGRGGSIYGPYYYFYEWAGHKLMGVPITTESARFISLCFWVGGSVIAFLLTYKATGSTVIAVVSQFLVFRALAFIPEFPSHPQELCIVAFLGLALAAYTKNPSWRMVWLGALTGVLTATKINTGVFAALTLAIVSIHAARPAWLYRLRFLAYGSLVFPVLLMWGHHGEGWGRAYWFVVEMSLFAALLAVTHMKLSRDIEIRHILIAGVSFAGAIAFGSLFSLLHGGSIYDWLKWTILAPGKSFSTGWFCPPYIRKEAIPLALVGLALAWYAATRRASEATIALLKLGFAGVVLFLQVIDSLHYDPTSNLLGWERSGGYSLIVFLAAPFLWLVAIPGSRDAGHSDGFARAWLALAAVIEMLYAYPVAATAHVRIVAVLMIVVAGVCLSDSLLYFAVRLPVLKRPVFARSLAAVTILAVLGFSFDMARVAKRRYDAFEPLDIAGLHRIHVPPSVAGAMHQLVQAIASNGCTTLFTVPSMFSLNLWTRTQPLTLAAGNWVNATSDEWQQQLIDSLVHQPKICVIYSQQLIKEWQFPDKLRMTTEGVEDVTLKPLVRFILHNYRPEFRAVTVPRDRYVVDYEFMTPNPPGNERSEVRN